MSTIDCRSDILNTSHGSEVDGRALNSLQVTQVPLVVGTGLKTLNLDLPKTVIGDPQPVRVFEEDHAGSRPSQGLVGGGRHHVTVLEGRRMLARRHQATDVGNVGHEDGAHLESFSQLWVMALGGT